MREEKRTEMLAFILVILSTTNLIISIVKGWLWIHTAESGQVLADLL